FDWYPGKELYYNNTWEEELILLTVLEKSIDSIQLLDEKYYQCLKDDFGEAWLIRGIGDTGGFFCGIFPVPLDGSQFALLCFYIDDILVYSNPDFNYCGTVSINTEVGNNSEIKLYPNPSKGNVTVEFMENHIINTFNVFDINGSLIRAYDVKDKNVIEIQNLAKGVYVYVAGSKNNKKLSGKIIVQ
ncbi:T9SS type A sorting domain-containing protein, partial [Odoribacter sp. OttesenSCG-928-L07]|nr:T9SS type A sorting domain-containing protein [Odoribacter sp. OttesenSCG-928-L07]